MRWKVIHIGQWSNNKALVPKVRHLRHVHGVTINADGLIVLKCSCGKYDRHRLPCSCMALIKWFFGESNFQDISSKDIGVRYWANYDYVMSKSNSQCNSQEIETKKYYRQLLRTEKGPLFHASSQPKSPFT